MSNINVEGDLPQEVFPLHVFRRARDQEIDAIQKRLDSISLHGFIAGGPPYRYVVREEKYDGRTTYHHEELPRESWRYWVVAFENTNHKVRDIEHAALLLPTDFDIGLTLFFSEADQQGSIEGWSGIPLHLAESYHDFPARTENARTLHSREIVRIRGILESIDAIPADASFVKRAIESYYSIRSIPGNSEIRVVGYFAIIESLVTHAPRLSETLDSINHQIVNKLILLRKRFERAIPVESFFLDAGEDRLWKLLYSYRSCLAHGEKPDFKSRFQVLKSGRDVTRFLREVIKELILFGLREPVFLADLKKC